MAHYVSDEYDKAIVDFKRAQQLYPSATLIYNIALARMRLGQTEEAVQAAERALDFEGPDQGFGRESQAKARAMIVGGGVLSAATQASGRLSASTTEPSKASSSAPSPEQFDGGGTPILGGLGWSGIALGAIGIGGMIGIPITGNQYERDLQQLRKLRNSNDRDAFESKRAEAQRARGIGQVLLYAGPALTALGVGMVALDAFVLRNDRASARMQVTPTGRWSLDIKW